MYSTIETQVGSHGTIRIEVEPTEGLREASALKRATQIARDAFNDAMNTAKIISKGIIEQFDQVQGEARPDKVSLEFGIKLSSEAGALVAKASADAHFKINLTWEYHN